MRAVSTLILIILGASIHCSCAIKCYLCQSLNGDYCDEFDKDNSFVTEQSCPSYNNACGVAKGKAKLSGGELYTGVIRGCVTATKEECGTLTNESIPGTLYTNAYGDYCVCTSDLCNSAPQTSVGRLLIGFTVISLLTLATGRFLSQ